MICTGSLCLGELVTLGKYQNTNLLTGSVRKNNRTTYLLIRMTSIDTQTYMSLYGFIELGNRCLLYKSNGIGYFILRGTIHELCSLIILLSVFHLYTS